MGLESIDTPLLWIGFTLFVLAMLALDLDVAHRQAHAVRIPPPQRDPADKPAGVKP
jgi:hypothetical protein